MDITESVQNEANQLEKKIEVHEARAMWGNMRPSQWCEISVAESG